ncbi:MAG: hypothetical protein EBR82_15405 [Caulobacteraceae bacterium]|nr:hypothetical protein [Caulobacteraceae bacterium]
MIGPINTLNLESAIEQSEPLDGYREDRLVFPQGAWLTGTTDIVLTGATTPARATLTVNSVAITTVVQWAANAAATVIAGVQFAMPYDYNANAKRQGDRVTDDLVFRAAMRRQRNAADSGAWSARCTVRWWRPGTDTTAGRVLSTNPTAAIATIAADNTALLTGFNWVEFDIGARLRAEGVQILAGDIVTLLVGPDAQNANAVLQMAASHLRFRRNLGLPRSLR